MADRFHKPQRAINTINVPNSFVLVDSPEFNRPESISLQVVGECLQLKINEDLLKDININVVSVDPRGMESAPQLPPDSIPVSSTLHLAADENYLYIWVQKLGRWKRLLLSEWNSLDS